MGMSTHVVGFKPPDDKWRAMKAIWDACTAAKIDPPEAVSDFFEGEAPDERGVEVDLEGYNGIATEWQDDARQGYEVHLDRLPPGVTVIRFWNSW